MNKELLHLLYRELIKTIDFLDKIIDDPDKEKLENARERLIKITIFLNNDYHLYVESESYKEYDCVKKIYKMLGEMCHDCGTKNVDCCLVKKVIWDEFGCGEEVLCISCLEKRLNRSLILEDFDDNYYNRKSEFVKSLKRILN